MATRGRAGSLVSELSVYHTLAAIGSPVLRPQSAPPQHTRGTKCLDKAKCRSARLELFAWRKQHSRGDVDNSSGLASLGGGDVAPSAPEFDLALESSAPDVEDASAYASAPTLTPRTMYSSYLCICGVPSAPDFDDEEEGKEELEEGVVEGRAE